MMDKRYKKRKLKCGLVRYRIVGSRTLYVREGVIWDDWTLCDGEKPIEAFSTFEQAIKAGCVLMVKKRS